MPGEKALRTAAATKSFGNRPSKKKEKSSGRTASQKFSKEEEGKKSRDVNGKRNVDSRKTNKQTKKRGGRKVLGNFYSALKGGCSGDTHQRSGLRPKKCGSKNSKISRPRQCQEKLKTGRGGIPGRFGWTRERHLQTIKTSR